VETKSSTQKPQVRPAGNETGLPKVKVTPARKVIQKPRELFAAAEGHLVAIKALSFGTHVFNEDQGPVEIAEVAVVDLEGDEPTPLAVLEISWRHIVRQLAVGDRDSWQIGTLVEEPEYQAKQLEPPGDDVDLEAIADKLGRLQAAALNRPKQLALSSENAPEPDGDIPF
jgi:hypothetical protein